jgi:hypothetical protein
MAATTTAMTTPMLLEYASVGEEELPRLLTVMAIIGRRLLGSPDKQAVIYIHGLEVRQPDKSPLTLDAVCLIETIECTNLRTQ